MFDDETKVRGAAIRFVDLLRGMGVQTVSPCDGVQPHIMDAVATAVREGFFSLTMLGHLNDGLRIAVIEYLNAEPSQGYNIDGVSPRATVCLKNVSMDPFSYVATAREVSSPQGGNVVAYSSVTRRPSLRFYERVHATIEPGGVAIMGAGKGHAKLEGHCLPYHDRNKMHQPKSPKVKDQLREVWGELTVYDGGEEHRLVWGEKPHAAKGRKEMED